MNNNFGEFLYQLRKEKGVTQAELADNLGITNKAISKWETGEAFPETAQLLPIAKYFNITVDELLRGEKNNNLMPTEEKENVIENIPYTRNQILAISIAIGIMLLGLLATITLTMLDVNNGIYVSILIGSVALGVFILILSTLNRVIKSANLDTDTYIKGRNIIIRLAIGICLTIIAIIPIIVLESTGYSEKIYLPVFFAVLVISVPIIVFSGIQYSDFTKKYTIPRESAISKGLEDKICGVIMLIATALYLFLGFVLNYWHPGWIVFPIGGILCGIISTIMKGNENKK
jgi:transcriptional regulator with XRE-family HTH domain